MLSSAYQGVFTFKLGVTSLQNDILSNKHLRIETAASGIDLCPVNGSVKIQDSGDNSIIELDAGNTHIRMKDDTNTNDYFDIEVGAEGATTIKTYDAGSTVGHLTLVPDGNLVLDPAADLVLDPASGNFIAKNAGTEFSAANSAYAGMILGYTDIGLDEGRQSYSLTTSFVVQTDEHGVTFKAPPSGNVEIFTQIGRFYAGSGGAGSLIVGLSDANATSGYNAVDDFHEELILDNNGRYAYLTPSHTWTITGLTPGTSYTYYVGVKTGSTSGTPLIEYGGAASGHYASFIMKATALPATIST